MSERALEIRLGNGVEVLGEEEFYFDAETIGTSGTFCISHAHSDHLPKRVEGREVVCSDVTLKCIEGRTKHPLNKIDHPGVAMFDAGHMAGSRMFQAEQCGKRVLYTGDLCTRDRFGCAGAKPVKTDVLIIESTYGRPGYVFPPSEEMGRVMHDWAEDTISQGHSAAMFAYPFGKSQDLIKILDDMDPLTDQSVYNATSAISSERDPYNFRLYSEELANDPFVVVCTPWFRKSSQADCWRRNGMRTAAVSGWALDRGYRYKMRVDEAFPFSDHADFEELLAFTKACEPSVVLTHHGFDADLAREIESRLGIEARPLIKNQRSLLEF
ncbi:MBL fold metallo-hydrolase RNA specificity domain-containing protein [Methanomassiliicoccus luminyensis]|uniref:MBL fold metallo-hydrolase RNA specificity domain-containing protein n=1 Tax=Methanomassiliicoccus luminyensis TaxID=1080712 RepID=UPI00138AF379|nr:MBL fold metallo-hydrolase RNA specificity domain-containing protein [Methanomassiliicoccus luminyensis]